jgi:hypothetical protein
MKAKTSVLTLAFYVAAAVVAFAASEAQMGTWKLNESKSKIGAGMPKNDTVVYEAAGENVKVTIDGAAGDGTKTHSEWTGKMDGKDYPSTGNPGEDTRAYTKVSARTLRFASKKDGKVVLSGTVTVSADGKTRTVTSSGKSADGKTVKSVLVYDKQ